MYSWQDVRERLRRTRVQMDSVIEEATDQPAIINAMPVMIRQWQPGQHNAGDVRMHDDIPYKCVQTHDSTQNPDWTPDATPALWMQYHGTSIETARAWVQPAGSHDRYKAGEYMVWTDGDTYRCLSDTTYTPTQYPAAWAKES